MALVTEVCGMPQQTLVPDSVILAPLVVLINLIKTDCVFSGINQELTQVLKIWTRLENIYNLPQFNLLRVTCARNEQRGFCCVHYTRDKLLLKLKTFWTPLTPTRTNASTWRSHCCADVHVNHKLVWFEGFTNIYFNWFISAFFLLHFGN